MSPKNKREIEGLDEELKASGKPTRWEQFRLPVELEGRSFLDVGCWEGVHCADALRHGARDVVGIDLATGDDLAKNLRRYGFEFIQMDVSSESWLGVGRFDVVLCAGLLYQVPDPMSLLLRLHHVSTELLVLETGFTYHGGELPMMLFHGGGEGTTNPVNWWTPNRGCLEQMLETAGFKGVSVVWEEERKEGYGRICVHAVPSGEVDRARLQPRKAKHASIKGGDRPGAKGPE
jgi:SAM-dependent methyltransferase